MAEEAIWKSAPGNPLVPPVASGETVTIAHAKRALKALLTGILCLSAVLMCLSATPPAPVFDLTLPKGLDFTLENSPTPLKYLIEAMPGGVALLDYNNDGLRDIFLVNGGRITSPMRHPDKFDRSNPRYWNRLYRQ